MIPTKTSPVNQTTVTHRGTVRLSLAELADVVAQLRCGVDRVIWLIGDDGAYMIVTPADIPAVEDFIADRSDTLTLPGGTLDEEWMR